MMMIIKSEEVISLVGGEIQTLSYYISSSMGRTSRMRYKFIVKITRGMLEHQKL